MLNLFTYYRIWRLSNLKTDHVKYDPNEQIITVNKATVSLTIRCEFRPDVLDIDGLTKNFIFISGDPLVVENSVVEAILIALWNTTAGKTPYGDAITFGEVIVRADPNFFTIQKVELVPLKKSIFIDSNKRNH